MVKVLNGYPQTVSITASSIRAARTWAKEKRYNDKTVESSRLGEKNEKLFSALLLKIYNRKIGGNIKW